MAQWNSATPNAFSVSSANDSASDLSTSADGTLFAMRSNQSAEIRGQDLTLLSSPVFAEYEGIVNRVAVPGMAMHPSGALLYDPFLDGPPPSAPPAQGIRGGIDIRDAHSGRLRLRLYFPEPLAMLSTDLNGLDASFLTTDQYGQYIFAITTSGLTILQLANVPWGIGSLSPSSGAGGSHKHYDSWQRFPFFDKSYPWVANRRTLHSKAATHCHHCPGSFPALAQLFLTNADGETVSLDAAFLAQ